VLTVAGRGTAASTTSAALIAATASSQAAASLLVSVSPGLHRGEGIWLINRSWGI